MVGAVRKPSMTERNGLPLHPLQFACWLCLFFLCSMFRQCQTISNGHRPACWLGTYMLLFDLKGVTPVFCELHAPVDYTTSLMAYEDDTCTCLLANLIIDPDTKIVERLGVDSSCFTLNEHHFAARTVAEKTLWIRAISNIKVKLRHALLPTSDLELKCYRNAVEEQIAYLPSPRLPAMLTEEAPLLKRRAQPCQTTNPANPGLHAPRTPSAASENSSEGPFTPPASAKVAVAVWSNVKQLAKHKEVPGQNSWKTVCKCL